MNASDIAHIVADSRQGPRGREEMTEDDRNKHTNLILLCLEHHRVIDAQKHTYTVAVLRQMKADHESRVASLGEAEAPLAVPVVEELLHSTMLPITHMPGAVFVAPCKFPNDFKRVIDSIVYPRGDRSQLFPFVLRDGNIHTFQDLTKTNNAFAEVTNWRQAIAIPSMEFWSDDEGHRRFVDLLNRAVRRHLGMSRIFWDKDHHRYFFPALEDGQERVVTYRTLNMNQKERSAAWCPRKKSTGEPRKFWWHLAAGLRFERVADKQWHLSIRPERHLTHDGKTPLAPEKVGPRVTRLKARMYNDKYLAEVQFWRDILCGGNPRLILSFGDQSVVCENTLVTCKIKWPGVPDDEKPFKNQSYDDDLFTISDLHNAIANRPVTDDEPDEFGEFDEDEEEDG